MHRFYEANAIQRGSDLVTDTTSETKSAVADMEGFDEITFAVELGDDVDTAAVLTFAVKENTADSTTSPSPTAVALTGESGLGTITSGNLVVTESAGNITKKTVLISVARSAMTKRYVFLSITATVESYVVNAITIIKSRSKALPVTQPSNVVSLAYAAA